MWVQKSPAKFPPNSHPKNQKKNHRRVSAGAPGEQCGRSDLATVFHSLLRPAWGLSALQLGLGIEHKVATPLNPSEALRDTQSLSECDPHRLASPLACYRSLSGPKCPGSFPRGVSGALGAPGLRSVQKVSRECPWSVKKVSRTLRGHSRDTWTLRSPEPEGPERHPEGTLPGHFGPRGLERLL